MFGDALKQMKQSYEPPKRSNDGFVPSKYQQAIFDFVGRQDGHAIIEAVAGSGKTTTIVKSMAYIPRNKSALFLAFNKSIQVELSRRVPSHVQTMTLNGLGHRAIMKAYGRVKLDTNKPRILWDMLEYDDINPIVKRAMYQPVRDLFNAARQAGIVPNGHGRAVAADTFENWLDIIESEDIDFGKAEEVIYDMGIVKEEDEGAVEKVDAMLTRYAIEMCCQMLILDIKMTSVIDFQDQLYLTVTQSLDVGSYDVVFIDESQDTDNLQRMMVKMAVRPVYGRMIAVGDSKQAIYSFRGSDEDSMDQFQSYFECKKMPLSISYRCPKKVIDLAKTIVPHIEHAPGATDGDVRWIDGLNAKDLQPLDVVICRVNAALMGLAVKLIKLKKPFVYVGVDYGKSLIRFVDKISKDRNLKIDDFLSELNKWFDKEVLRRTKKGMSVDPISDKVDSLKALIDGLDPEDTYRLKIDLESIFNAGKENSVILSTIHRFKGQEADRVYILNYGLMDYFKAKNLAMKMQGKHVVCQEDNLKYVAITRAKKELILESRK